jgi:hypothetical protein
VRLLGFIAILGIATAIGLNVSGALGPAGRDPIRTIYVGQAGAGNRSGQGGCANARPLSWLNAASNWGAGDGQIRPGVTVGLCGTITGQLETKKSGSGGKPITILFMANAKIAKGGAGCPSSGCISVAPSSEYITIDGGSNGVIENTDRGTGKLESAEPTTGIEARGCKHCTIEDLEIANLYVAVRGHGPGATEIRGIQIREGTPEYDTVNHDVFHDLGWAVNIEAAPTTSHIDVERDTFYHLTHGFSPTAGFSGGSIGPVVFAHNHFYRNLNWEAPGDPNHVDGVHCYSTDAKGYTPHYTGLYIYDNYITMEGADNTAPIYIEGGSGEGSTPCADSTSNIWVFNNVLAYAKNVPEGADGLLGAFSGEPHLYNNTLLGNSTTVRVCEVLNDHVAAEVRFTNNLATRCKVFLEAEKERLAAGGVEHNLWADGGSGGTFVCIAATGKREYTRAELSSWQACLGNDMHSRMVSNARLDLKEVVGVQGKPYAGSPALAAGVNLTSLCPSTPARALCRNINGEARPSTGAWNIGAY